MRYYGYVKSDMSDVQDASKFVAKTSLPKEYSMLEECTDIIDQGNRGICVSCSMQDLMTSTLKRMNKPFKRPVDYYYNLRVDKKIDGMTVKEAMEIAKKDKEISMFAKVQDPDTLKRCILNNGAVAVCLPVNNTNDIFWRGKPVLGGHCVTFVGWTSTGFILKNSWGYSYNQGGTIEFPYDDWKYILEIWTVLK